MIALLGVVGLTACTIQDVKEDLGVDEQSLKCEGFAKNGSVDARFSTHLKAFMEASVDLEKVSLEARATVKDTCTRIAVDLGETSDLSGDDDDALNRACGAASARIEAIMSAHANANFSLQYVRGGCRQDFEEVKKCDQQCKEVETCEPGTVEERCTPGELSVECNGKCKAEATCQGTFDLAANCMGKCESECQGECKGTCTAKDGKKTENDPNCRGKCSATCNGKCRGQCKVEAAGGIECGVKVRCKGGCEAQYTAPSCETHCTPPKCMVSTSCWEACTSKVEAKTVCEPTRVELWADASVHADVQKLVTTVNANLGILVEAAEIKGKMVVDTCGRLVAAGKVVVEATSQADLEATACAGVATKKAANAAARLQVSVAGSANVVGACSKRSN